MALVLKKAGSLLTKVYLRDTANFSSRRVFTRGLLVYSKAQVERKGNDAREGKNVNSQDKNEKKTKEEAFSASMVVRVRRSPTPPDPSDGGGGKMH